MSTDSIKFYQEKFAIAAAKDSSPIGILYSTLTLLVNMLMNKTVIDELLLNDWTHSEIHKFTQDLIAAQGKQTRHE